MGSKVAAMIADAVPPFRKGDGVVLGNLAAFAEWSTTRAKSIMEGSKAVLRVALPGLDLALYSKNADYVQLVRDRVVGARVSRCGGENCRVLVTSPGVDGLPAPPAWGSEVFHSRDFERTLANTSFRTEFDHNLQSWRLFDLRQNIGLQWMPSDSAYPSWEPGSPLRVFFHWYYSARNMRLAHAGTLGKNGIGILLIGPGGAGKSGTVAGGILCGLQSVGDDYVLLDMTDRYPIAYPVFHTLKQDAQGLQRLGVYDRIAKGRETNWQNKFEFFSGDLGGAQMERSLQIRAMLIPCVCGTKQSELARTSGARAMLALAPSGLFQMPGERDSGVARFSQLARSLPCFSLALGSSVEEVSSTISAFLDELQ
jgi:hypothetical protein